MAEYIIDQDVETYLETVAPEYGGFWARFGAAIVDSLVMIPISGMIIVNTWLIKSLPLQVLLILLSILYKPLLEFKYGATVGKMALKLKVVGKDMGKISLSTAFIRFIPWLIGSIISLFSAAILFADQAFIEDKTYIGSMQAQGDVFPSYVQFIGGALLLITGLSILFNSSKQGIHDLMAGTYCIKKEE